MRSLRLFLLVLLAAAPVFAGPTFRVTFDKSIRDQPASGRLVIYLVREGSAVRQDPAEGPFWEDPQPLFGVDVKDLAPGVAATIDDAATFFPVKLGQLPKGAYRIQAVLDLHHDNSDWKREPGNLYSDVKSAALDPAASDTIAITLNHAVAPRPVRNAPGVEYVEIPSRLLSDFNHRPISLRAGVALPIGYDPASDRRYAAVYEIPGFGGDHTGAAQYAAVLRVSAHDTPAARLARESFWIVLDPESGNGHTLFADSANNGPRAQALIKELIPALEAKYKLIPQPSARLLRGHSSGGWSSLWLALKYADTFGATWSTSPDPVDFRRFQLPNIYDDAANMYGKTSISSGPTAANVQGTPLQSFVPYPSYRVHGQPKMTIRQENLMEEVLGPGNTSGQQWDSWMAVFGPRNDHGHPAALFSPESGDIDPSVALQFLKYDIGARLREHPAQYLPLFRNNIRIVVGEQDSFYLNEAVALLKTQVDELNAKAGQAPGWGSIKILPNHDHNTIAIAADLQSIPTQMLDRLRQSGHAPAAR